MSRPWKNDDPFEETNRIVSTLRPLRFSRALYRLRSADTCLPTTNAIISETAASSSNALAAEWPSERTKDIAVKSVPNLYSMLGRRTLDPYGRSCRYASTSCSLPISPCHLKCGLAAEFCLCPSRRETTVCMLCLRGVCTVSVRRTFAFL